jgi:YqaJ-like viral recombinase domain
MTTYDQWKATNPADEWLGPEPAEPASNTMLTPEQIAARKNKLTASRVACLMQGDAVKIMQLYLEMIGDAIEEDLSHIWPIRLGEATEQLQCDWFEEKNHVLVTRRGEVVVHPDYPWAACTLDGFIEDDR